MFPTMNNNNQSSTLLMPKWSHHWTPPDAHSINPDNDHHFCKAILYEEIRDTSIRIWDFMIFGPNFIFLLFLLWRFQRARDRVRALNQYPILRNFYIFIYLCVTVSMMRCFVSVVMKVNTTGGDLTDKIFWVIVRFFLLSTEISVLVFGLFSGHLDVRSSIRRILWITLAVSLIYSVCQGSFEIIAPDASFYVTSRDYYLYGHGGMVFWFCTCLLSFLVYFSVVLLPYTPCRNRLLLPAKRSFYIYAGLLAVQNLVQAMGALAFYLNQMVGLCVVDATTYLYFTLFTPLVYFTFLSPFLAVGSSNSGASALVTTTAGSETNLRAGASGGRGPVLRPTNLFTSGLRGAVNFSYRPQVEDDDLQDDDDFGGSSSVGSSANFATGGLHFDHYGPYGHHHRQGGYLVYSGQNNRNDNMARNISSYSFQTSSVTPMVEQAPIAAGLPGSSDKLVGLETKTTNESNSTLKQQQLSHSKSDHLLLESHMLQDQNPFTHVDSTTTTSLTTSPLTTRQTTLPLDDKSNIAAVDPPWSSSGNETSDTKFH